MNNAQGTIAIVGTGYVADLYMRSFKTFPGIETVGAFDIDDARLKAFCEYWNVSSAESLDALFANKPDLVLNLTNPSAHYDVSSKALSAGLHVYSEKPLAVTMDEAHALHKQANESGLLLASAPCSWLSESAQTVWKAISNGEIGIPRLVYAELDDDFIPAAPYDKWVSESGAPWPAKDEFETGCTLEHAGYYLTWLMAIFGPVAKVVAASADLIPDKLPDLRSAPDYSTAVLFFKSGTVARLTCSIIAPHDHRLRIIGDEGVLELEDCWKNEAPVRIRRRFVLRHALKNSPFAKRTKIGGETHPKVSRKGAASMNFALGPAAMLAAMKAGSTPVMTSDFALHLNEITLAIQNAHDAAGAQVMTTTFDPVRPMPWAEAAGAKPGGRFL